MKIIKFLILNLLLVISVNAIANSTEINLDTDDLNGQNRIYGCPGGSVPSENGKYYLPNNKTECNAIQTKAI